MQKREFISFPECNKYSLALSTFFSPLSLFLSLSRYISWYTRALWLQLQKLGTWPGTFGQLQFAANPLQEPRTFSFNIAFALYADCYEIHPTKCVLRFERRAFVRLTRSFARRATFTKPLFIWLGGGGLFAQTHMHTRTHTHTHPHVYTHRGKCPFYARFSDISPAFPRFITFAIISLSGESRVMKPFLY